MAPLVADAVLVLHFAIAAFVTLGLPAVWVGAALEWAWVRNRAFRYLHLGAIGFVAAEALLGIACPVTVWENMLRGGTQPEAFIARWVNHLLYYDAPAWVFTTAYVAWSVATLATLVLVPPRRKAA